MDVGICTRAQCPIFVGILDDSPQDPILDTSVPVVAFIVGIMEIVVPLISVRPKWYVSVRPN